MTQWTGRQKYKKKRAGKRKNKKVICRKDKAIDVSEVDQSNQLADSAKTGPRAS